MDDDSPVLDQLNLVVRNMQASTDFYRRLGLDIQDRDPGWDEHHRTLPGGGDLDLDLDSAAFARHWCRGWTAGRTGVVIGFRVRSRESVDRLYAELTGAGHRGLQAPYDAFWGARYAIVEDPDGQAVGLMSASDSSRRTPPPDPSTIE